MIKLVFALASVLPLNSPWMHSARNAVDHCGTVPAPVRVGTTIYKVEEFQGTRDLVIYRQGPNGWERTVTRTGECTEPQIARR